MTTSLSILLPVYNAEVRLEKNVSEILDVMPELTDRFEMVIIDDGSTDETAHVARDLALCYPQVSAIRHPIRLGLAEAIQTGLDNSDGEIVFVGDEQFGLDPHDVRELWKIRHQKDQILARASAPAPRANWIERLLPWRGDRRAKTAAQSGRLQVIRRPESEEIRLFRDGAGSAALRRIDGTPADLVQPRNRPTYRTDFERFISGE